jgi:hypothetical protein
MSLAAQIQKRIDELRANPKGISANELKIASSLNALPIYPDWSGFIAIRPDESFLFYSEDGLVEKYVEPEWQLVALIRGSKKYSELESLLPKRSTDASECVDCDGTGQAVFEGQQLDAVICDKCFGLGWVDGNINTLSEKARARLHATPGFFHLFGK